MNGGRAVCAKGRNVVGRPVAFMFMETVKGILFMIRDHQPVARHFGNDARRGDGVTKASPSTSAVWSKSTI